MTRVPHPFHPPGDPSPADGEGRGGGYDLTSLPLDRIADALEALVPEVQKLRAAVQARTAHEMEMANRKRPTF